MDKTRPNSPSKADATVSFRPVTEGLGFHPFSDGLPYAPMGKNPKPGAAPKSLGTSGTGAIAAGPPRVALRAPTLPKPSTSLDLSSSQIPRISVPVAKKEASGSGVQPTKLVLKKSSRGMAYVAARSLAYLFDVSLNSLVMGGILIKLVWDGEFQVDLLLGHGVPAATTAFFLVSGWLLIALQEILFRSSLGKYLFQLRLGGSRFNIALRALFFPLSVGFFTVGIFWGLFHGRRSCWHDILSGIQPAETGMNE